MSRIHAVPSNVRWWLTCSATLLSALLAASTVAEPCAPAFEHLRFQARKALVLSGELTLDASVPAADSALRELRSCDDGPACLPPGRCLVLLDAGTKAGSHVSQALTWLDSEKGSVVQVLEARRGRRWRLTRQTEDGHHQWTRRPANKRERRASIDEWSKRSEEHVAWPEPPGDLPRSSSFALLHEAMARRLDREGASAELVVYSKGRVMRVGLKAHDLVEVDVDYERRAAGGVERVEGRRPLRRVEVEGDTVGDDEGESAVSLLGLESDLELYLEPGTGLPVEIRGGVKLFGKVRVRLAEAHLAPASSPPDAAD